MKSEDKPEKTTQPKAASKDATLASEEAKKPWWESEITLFSGGKTPSFKPKDLVQFFRGVGAMLRAQMTTSDALYYYSKGLPNKKMAEVLLAIRDDLGKGISIHEAFKRSKRFNEMTIGLIHSGSDAGRLDEAFKALATRMETDENFKKKIKKVIIIPCIVIPILLATFIVAQINLVPQVEDMLDQVNQEPDPISKAAFGLSHIIQDFWVLIVLTLVGIVATLVISQPIRMTVLNLLMSRWRMLRLLVMSLRQLTLLSTIHLLHSNGINLVRSLRVSAATMSGTPLEKEIEQAADRYEHMGLSFAMSLSKYTSLDEQVCHMMAIGERSASIDDNLQLLADMYEEEAENQMEAMTHIINALVLGIAVALIAAVFISAFLPIFLMGPKMMESSL